MRKASCIRALGLSLLACCGKAYEIVDPKTINSGSGKLSVFVATVWKEGMQTQVVLTLDVVLTLIMLMSVMTILVVWIGWKLIKVKLSTRKVADTELPRKVADTEQAQPGSATPQPKTKQTPEFAHLQRKGRAMRSVKVQSPVTYQWHYATPRFKPLADYDHGAWAE